MPRNTGSAAAPKGAPESAESARLAVLAVLPHRLPLLSLLAAQVANSAAGPDPETALVYLRELRDCCSETLSALGG